MSFLVDANVLCEGTRPDAAPRVLAWLAQHDGDLSVSVITLGEILKGVCLLPRGRRRTRLHRWFVELRTSFEERILPVDLAIMETWAELYARNQKAGRLLPSFDSLLAATALRHGLTVATRNLADFPKEVSVVDPWVA